MDSRPVLIGVGQWVERELDPAQAPSPLDSLERVARAAAEDARLGADAIAQLDAVGIVDVIGWRPTSAPRLLAERLGARPAYEVHTGVGGEVPLVLVNRMARRIAAGESRFALVAGSNNFRTFRRARDARVKLDWPQGGGGSPDLLGTNLPGNTPAEAGYGMSRPTEVYPLFENALRARRGRGLDEHRLSIGRMMSRFTEVAANNPYAWFPVARSPEEIAEVSAANRMISYPYTKYMNAVMETDQAAGVLMCSRDAARELGVHEERWVHWWGGASGRETDWFTSDRDDFARCEAMGATAKAALGEAGLGLDDMTAFDFYSCFPVAVEMACEMLGLREDDPRGLTVAGGLPYAGGPGNNYPMHSLATMVERVRAGDDAYGLVTGNGWYMTKHSASVIGRAARPTVPSPETEAKPMPELADETEATRPADGAGVVETYTVVYDRDAGPTRGVIVGRTDAGRRFVANTPTDAAWLEDFASVENVGRRGRVRHTDGRNLFDPT